MMIRFASSGKRCCSLAPLTIEVSSDFCDLDGIVASTAQCSDAAAIGIDTLCCSSMQAVNALAGTVLHTENLVGCQNV